MTVLFADVANFTAMSEKLDPEEVHQVMDGCFRILMDEIHKYEGTINQFTGDGVMALFGAPVAHEDHSRRACYAALAIQNTLRDYAERLKKERGIDFKMRIGVNSGPVVVGSIGDDLRMDYTAIGDTVNLASRMETTAKPGAILSSEHTYKLARDYFKFESLGKIQVKGKEKPQEAYELLTTSEVKTRIEASVVSGLTKFVGRRREMEALQEALAKARSGFGQVVKIVGEAGVGKSRLIFEMRRLFPKEEYGYLEGRCLHYGSSMAYLPLLDIMRSYFEIKEGEQESIIKKKIKEKISELDEKLKTVLPPFQELLSLKVEDEGYIKLEPKQKRERIFEALRDLFIRESQDKPLVLVFEDLHWIDKTSEEFLNYLIGWLANTPILLILLYRPEYTHRWGSKSYYSNIRVDQLSIPTSAELVQSILKEGEVVPELRDLILGKAAGNPLFMEELTHSLLENGSIQKKDHQYFLSRNVSDIQVPDTIQGIIASRIDRLDENLKRIMQVASVIGREFAFRILQTITEMKEELKSHLLNLQGLEFIYEKRLFPELEYIFKHALTQEVAYNSLLIKKRREIHQKIGQAIEELYSERLEEFYEMLAYHYSKSDNSQKAITYWQLSGRRAVRLYAVNEGIESFSQALEKIEELPAGDVKDDLKLDVGTKLGFNYLLRNMFSEAAEIVRPLEKLALERKHLKSLGRIFTIMGISLTTQELKLNDAVKYLEKSIELSGQTGDIPAQSYGNTYLAYTYQSLGDLDAAKRVSNKIVSILEEKQSWYTLCVPYNALANVYLEEANGESADKWSRKAYQCAEKLDDPFTKSWGNLAIGRFCLEKGRFNEAEKTLSIALENSKKINLHIAIEVSLISLIHLYLRREEFDKSLKYIQDLHEIIERKGGLSIFWGACFTLESSVHLLSGNFNKSLKCLESALNYKIPYSQGHYFRTFGEYYREVTPVDFDASQIWYQKAVETHERIGMRLELARDLSSYGEMLKRNGVKSEAEKCFNKALIIFRDFGAAWDIHQIEEAMRGY